MIPDLRIQTGHRSSARSELAFLDSHLLHQTDKQIREWIIPTLVKCQMLTMFESTTGQHHRHVLITVIRSISQITRQ